MTLRAFVLAMLAASTATALAQPAGAPLPAGDKNDAKALLASGLKLFQAKDYLGALAVFKDAYARFPSAKILLNIGTTLKQLNRNAEAANTYQRYLDAKDTDPAKQGDVAKVLAELDAKVGLLEITATPADAEVKIGGEDEWRPAADVARYRVAPGSVTIRARAAKHTDSDKTVDVAAGKPVIVALTLVVIPEAPITPTVTAKPVDTDGGEVDEGPTPSTTTTRFGAYALAHIDVTHKGAAARVALTIELLDRLQAEVGGIIGKSPGGYVGARYAFLPGQFRPVLSVGAPIFIKDGAHVALRAAVGLEVILSPNISIVAEVGGERVLNPGMNYVENMFVPAIGAAGRL